MVSNKTYKLYGYIEYVASPVGFVTPVFKDESNEYFIQVSSTSKRKREWERLPDEYHPLVIPTKNNAEESITHSFLYGFKWDNSLFFGAGKDMAEYLSSDFLPKTKLGRELALGFIEDWASLEPASENFTKETIWKQCLDFIGNDSKTMPGIFLENFEVLGYKEGLLSIISKSESVKKVFETKFKEQIVSYIQREISNFQINITQETKTILPALPFIYFGGGEPIYTQGSFIIETRINPYKGFDNFIVSNFNAEAYQRALDFTEKEIPSLLLVRGAAGTGKSHLLHSIAKHLNKPNEEKKVGVYTVFSKPGSRIQTNESEIEHFETVASEKDVIIIDDAHNIKTEKKSLQRLVAVFKKWREMNKSIILSYRDPFQIEIVPELLENSQQLVLTQPDEIDKLKFLDLKKGDYNIHLTGRDILLLSKDVELRNISDIQRHLTRVYLTENIKLGTKNIFISHSSKDHFNSKWVEYCVYEYFNLNVKPSLVIHPDIATLNAKIISHFIQGIFKISHYETNINSEMAYVDGVFYSLDALQYYLFESKEFKETILDIVRELILGDKEK